MNDAALWMPYFHQICEAHNLDPSRLELFTGERSNVVALLPECVIKIYMQFLNGGASSKLEVAALDWLKSVPGVPSPGLFGLGELDVDNADWPWPYAVIARVPGSKLEDVWDDLPSHARLEIAAQLGAKLHSLHDATVSEELRMAHRRFYRKGWISVLEGEREKLYKDGRYGYLVPDPLPVEVEEFPIHADIEQAHIFIEGSEITGIIDFGDFKLGDPVYEMVSIALSFREPGFFPEVLRAYGMPWTQEVAERFALYTLLHEWGPLEELKIWAVESRAPDFDTFASWIYRRWRRLGASDIE